LPILFDRAKRWAWITAKPYLAIKPMRKAQRVANATVAKYVNARLAKRASKTQRAIDEWRLAQEC